MVTADTPLRYLKGVGPRRAEALFEAGLATVEDLLYVLPFRWEDRSAFARVATVVPDGAVVTLDVRVVSSRLIRTRRAGFTIFEAEVADDSGSLRCVWYNQPFLARVVVPGRRLALFGRGAVDRYGKRVVFENPELEALDPDEAIGIHTGRIVPVYRKLAGLSSRMQRTLIQRVLEDLAGVGLAAIVPGAPARLEALRDVHFPPPGTSIDRLAERRAPAQRALAYEEIYLVQLALAIRRRGVEQTRRVAVYDLGDDVRRRIGAWLPYKLTAAQRRVLKEIGDDLRREHPMHRLLQGDVGSGKTIVALLTMLVAVESGYQAALMAPTEILAEQHHRTFTRLIEAKGVAWTPTLLTGSSKGAARRAALAAVASGEARIVIGTHALFEKGVRFARLALVVVDEQHRFGVAQRQALASKGERTDLLVMTATPIPRSLAMTLYGDLDLSVIDEMPPGRMPITTVVRREADRARVYEGVRQEIAKGRQAYVVVPLVEETQRSDLKAAVAFAEELRGRWLPGGSVGLVHGKLKGTEKDRVMRAFAAGEVRVLVATTVVEVGVDVPNASVMVVEHAERFGLSQLHQLRGRVGRGTARSWCVLMVGDEEASRAAEERLAILEASRDGFRIAEKDLELRGPGAVFGTQQHGLSDLQFLGLVLRDPGLLEEAREAARDRASRDFDGAVRCLAGLRPGFRKRLALASVG